jgi:low affinity Fe/Cu permease
LSQHDQIGRRHGRDDCHAVDDLFIQRSEHRDTQAIHAKLDELSRANGEARNQLTHLDDRELRHM